MTYKEHFLFLAGINAINSGILVIVKTRTHIISMSFRKAL
jgi:hypothetical protein